MFTHAAVRLSLVAVVLLAGCTGAQKMRDEPLTAGDPYPFRGSYDYVKRAAREALIHAKYDITEEKQIDPDTYAVLGLMGMGWQSHGQWGRVVVKKASDTQSWAWIHTMKRVEMNITENIDIMRVALAKYMMELVELYKEDEKAAARQRR